jgi:hypothetical protein
VVGLRQADGMPHEPQRARSSVDPTVSLGAWPRKHLTKNQVLGSGHTAGQSPRLKIPLAYINCYINGYGRP